MERGYLKSRIRSICLRIRRQVRTWRHLTRLRDVYGWLATINPGKVAPEAREAVTRYRRECYDVLYEHFTCSMQRTIETNNAEIELLRQINSAISDEKEAKDRRKKAEKDLDKLRAARLDPQPSLFG